VRIEITSGKEYPVYTVEEADKLGLSYKHPFLAEEGEYGITEEGEVSLCLKKGTLKTGRVKVKYPWGLAIMTDENASVKSTGRLNNYTLSGKENRGKYIKSKYHFQKLAYYMAQPGMTKERAIRLVYGPIRRSKKHHITRTIRTKEFGDMVKEELDQILDKFPIGKMDTARALAAVLDKVMDWDADEKMGPEGDPKIAISVLDRLMDMNSMKNKNKIITTKQIEASTVENTLADIHEQKKLFKATQTEETHGVESTSEEEEESK
jgi:hypothetical protein